MSTLYLTPNTSLVVGNIQCFASLVIYFGLVSDLPVNFTVFENECHGKPINSMSIYDSSTIATRMVIDDSSTYCFRLSSNNDTKIIYYFNSTCQSNYDECKFNLIISNMSSILGTFILTTMIFILCNAWWKKPDQPIGW